VKITRLQRKEFKAEGFFHEKEEGAILGVVLVIMLSLNILLLSMFHLGTYSARETEYELQRVRAFWLAEAGRQWCQSDLDGSYFSDDQGECVQRGDGLSAGTFDVVKISEDASSGMKTYESTGVFQVGTQQVRRRVRFDVRYRYVGFEKVLFGQNVSGEDWTFQLRGLGSGVPPYPIRYQHVFGGPDTVLGDISVHGNMSMYGNSSVGIPDPNNFGLEGNVAVSGLLDGVISRISGNPVPWQNTPRPDFLSMNYAQNNDYNVAEIFDVIGYDASSGRLNDPSHPLYDRVVKNPSNRSEENSSTTGDDYYFEPVHNIQGGSPADARTPLSLGDNKVYYVDGHIWFYNEKTYGFEVDGQASLISTRDIHISNNLRYADRGVGGDLLALIAVGQYDTGGGYSRDGNVYFGDPRYGTMYTVDAFMFANNDFLYNAYATTGEQGEPESGFQIFGNFMAMNQVVLLRDWYDPGDGKEYRLAFFDPISGQWKDEVNGTVLLPEQTDSDASDGYGLFRHYAMHIGYDDRIYQRGAGVNLQGLPPGPGRFDYIEGWREVAVD